MNVILTIAFASIAAIGNALFALGQRQSAGSGNGLLFVGLSAFLACVLAVLCAPLFGPITAAALVRDHGRALLFSGTGLFLTYVGFNLLYGHFGASSYVVYAALAIITTTIGVGFLHLHEPLNRYHVVAMLLAGATIAVYSVGQSKL